MRSKRLGKGLDALIPQISSDEEKKRGESLNQIEIKNINTNPFQPRLEFDPERLEQLKNSISENGVIQPITVREVDGGYELIAGERRLRAVQELGFSEIPAYIMTITSENQLLELALVENIQRDDLNPIELAKAYHKLQIEHGLTQEAVAQKVGKDRATIANFIRLLKLPDQIQESLRHEDISMGHARAIIGLSSKSEQIQIWKNIVKNGWSVRKVEEEIRKQLNGDRKEKTKDISPKSSNIATIEDRLRTLFGTQVKVRTSKAGGKIEISYYSNDDLVRILEIFDELKA
jgi:ParB family chromosome partitioning protein